MWGLVFYNNDAHSVLCEGWYFIITMLTQLYVRVGIINILPFRNLLIIFLYNQTFNKNIAPQSS
jgi:hypothetical protein